MTPFVTEKLSDIESAVEAWWQQALARALATVFCNALKTASMNAWPLFALTWHRAIDHSQRPYLALYALSDTWQLFTECDPLALEQRVLLESSQTIADASFQPRSRLSSRSQKHSPTSGEHHDILAPR